MKKTISCTFDCTGVTKRPGRKSTKKEREKSTKTAIKNKRKNFILWKLCYFNYFTWSRI